MRGQNDNKKEIICSQNDAKKEAARLVWAVLPLAV